MVIPIYNEEQVIPMLVERLNGVLQRLACPAEVILVNDGTSDASVVQLRDLAVRDSRYKVICFARTFGHQAAATAGLDTAHGDDVVLMDADLQDPPDLLLEMLAKYREGYDVV